MLGIGHDDRTSDSSAKSIVRPAVFHGFDFSIAMALNNFWLLVLEFGLDWIPHQIAVLCRKSLTMESPGISLRALKRLFGPCQRSLVSIAGLYDGALRTPFSARRMAEYYLDVDRLLTGYRFTSIDKRSGNGARAGKLAVFWYRKRVIPSDSIRPQLALGLVSWRLRFVFPAQTGSGRGSRASWDSKSL